MDVVVREVMRDPATSYAEAAAREAGAAAAGAARAEGVYEAGPFRRVRVY